MNTQICLDFKIHVKTQYLSPHITYAVNLVFCLYDSDSTNSHLEYTMAGETESSSLYLADTREDGWLTAELYQFTSDNRYVDLEITFKCWNKLLVEGIEFEPVEIVSQQILEHQELEDEREVDMQEDMSHSDAYWKEKLPSDYETIIKWSKDKLHWTTKKELYSILCKGFLIQIQGEEVNLLFPYHVLQICTYIIYSCCGKLQNSQTSTYIDINKCQWFSLDKDGNKYIMLPAKVALKRKKWSWRYLPESRFFSLLPLPVFYLVTNAPFGALTKKPTFRLCLAY